MLVRGLSGSDSMMRPRGVWTATLVVGAECVRLLGSAGKVPEGDRAEVVGGTCGLTLSMKLPVSARAGLSFDRFGRSFICGLVGRRHCFWSLLGSLSWYLWGSWKCSPRTTDGF